jgi:hypothetical protein
MRHPLRRYADGPGELWLLRQAVCFGPGMWRGRLRHLVPHRRRLWGDLCSRLHRLRSGRRCRLLRQLPDRRGELRGLRHHLRGGEGVYRQSLQRILRFGFQPLHPGWRHGLLRELPYRQPQLRWLRGSVSGGPGLQRRRPLRRRMPKCHERLSASGRRTRLLRQSSRRQLELRDLRQCLPLGSGLHRRGVPGDLRGGLQCLPGRRNRPLLLESPHRQQQLRRL